MAEDYKKAKRMGDISSRKAVLAGQSPVLPALDEILGDDDSRNPIFVGTMEIPLSQVKGTRTSGRKTAFAPDFMPVVDPNSEFAEKWSSLLASQMEEGIRDPILVYEYMREFYVQEGNKRVSVSKYVGAATILAEVWRIVPKHADDPEHRQYEEFLRFFEVAPVYEIAFTKEGSYRKLADLLGQDLDHAWTSSTIRDLKYMYSMFSRVFYSRGGWNLHLTCGDAFLIYLSIYGKDSLLSKTPAQIDRRLEKAWNEIVLADHGDEIDVVERPEEQDQSLLSILLKNPGFTAERPLRTAFIYDSTPEKSRWCYGHETGRTELEERFQGAVSTRRFDDCRSDEEIRRAIDEAVADGCSIIFTTASNQMKETLRSAIHFPEVRFMNCSVNLSHKAVQTYYVRMYSAKFLMGALAASLADNHRIGYRAAYPIFGALADINAFAIGAALIDPKASVYLSWASTSDSEWNTALEDNEIRIVSGPDINRPDTNSREYGIYERKENGEIRNLAAPVLNWGLYYDLILRPSVEGQPVRKTERADRAINYWWGMSAGVVDIRLSDELDYYSRKLMNAMRNSLILGKLNPFDGELHSTEGIVKEAGTPRLANEEIIRMNWLNDNVIGRIPQREELPESVWDKIEVSGV